MQAVEPIGQIRQLLGNRRQSHCQRWSRATKLEYFKRAANYGLFFGEVVDPLTGEVKIQERSTSTLTTAEMTEAIERFRNWSAMTEAGHPGIYLPEPNERDYLNEIEHEIERNKKEMV